MSARDVVLGRIRSALGPDPVAPDIPRSYRRAGHLDAAARLELFAERVDDYRATVHRTDRDGLAATVGGILLDAGARRVVVPPGLPDSWVQADDDLEVVRDDGLPTSALDTVDAVLTGSAVAIAETGTVVLDASDDQGRRALTLVPDHHVCVVQAEDVVETVPEALRRLDPTRPLTLISGPSATSDIELDRVEGVHGPRTLDVVIVERELPSS